MELLPITLAANETKQFAKAGRYFELITCDYPLQVDFTGTGGNLTDTMRNAISGLFLEDPYTHFAITNGAVAQTIVVLLMESGRGGSRRQPGIVSVTNKIGAGIVQAELLGGALLPSGFTATVVVAAGANPRGLLIRKAKVSGTAGASGNMEVRLIAAPVVPATTVPANAYNMADASAAATLSATDFHVDQNYQVPAGWGIWCVTNHGFAAAGVAVSLAYEPL